VPDPVLHLVAGPNGSGKSSFFDFVLAPVTGLPFVNADVIAVARWPDTASEHAYEAAAWAAGERDRLIASRASFATETVFSHPSKLVLLETADAAGYLITLHVVVVPEDLAVARVTERVRQGGHTVPENKVRTRYRRLWGHVARAIERVEEAHVYDNTRANTPFRVVARYRKGRLVGSPVWPSCAPDELRADGLSS